MKRLLRIGWRANVPTGAIGAMLLLLVLIHPAHAEKAWEVKSVDGVLKNSTGVEVRPEWLRFILPGNIDGSAYNNWYPGQILGLQAGTNYFYVWQKTASGTFSDKPACEGYLRNSQGTAVPVDSIEFAVLVDRFGVGRQSLVISQANSNYVAIYDFDTTRCRNNYQFQPSAEGYLYNSVGAPVLSDYLRFAVSGDFDGDGHEELLGMQTNTSWAYIWDLASNSNWRFSLQRDGDLLDSASQKVAVNNLIYVHVTVDDPTNSNTPSPWKNLVLALSGDTYYAWGSPGKPTWQQSARQAAQAIVKRKLIFSLDQGWSNGLVLNADPYNQNYLAALDRIIAALLKFNQKYDVYALIHPIIKDRTKIQIVLDQLHAAGIKFLFDAYSSDGNAIGSYTQGGGFNQLADIAHGIAMFPAADTSQKSDPNFLDYYQARYGANFAGLRFMELVGHDYIVNLCRNGKISCSLTLPGAGDYVYRTDLAEKLVAFALHHNMFVMWNDNDWFNRYSHTEEEYRLSLIRSDMEQLAARWLYTIYVNYDNNEGTRPSTFNGTAITKDCPSKLPTEELAYQDYRRSRHKRLRFKRPELACDNDALYGDTNCPAADVAIWAVDALSKGANIVQIEPFWYFFNWPRGELSTCPQIYAPVTGKGNCEDPTSSVDWSQAGLPTQNLIQLAGALGVYLDGGSSFTLGMLPDGLDGPPAPPLSPTQKQAADKLGLILIGKTSDPSVYQSQVEAVIVNSSTDAN